MRAGLADGSVRVVIGTHALASDTVVFRDLGLLVIDEEQRFGVRHEEQLRAKGTSVHRLTMTATPIPRTLQTAMVGLQDLSTLATPPIRRQPVRTVVAPFNPVAVQEALRREHRRGGRYSLRLPVGSAILPALEARLSELVPELRVLVAHGKMKPATLDETVLRFARGEGDVLLATDLVEAGLDIPSANTLLVWRPGSVRPRLAPTSSGDGSGGGASAGSPGSCSTGRTASRRRRERRLRTIESHDRLGAGFAISVRDLDRRGAGELGGEAQAGHVRRIGLELYQHLLGRALAVARGERPEAGSVPELRLDLEVGIPIAYVPEPEVRLRSTAGSGG